MKCVKFHARILKIIKIYVFHYRITKIKKNIEFHARITKKFENLSIPFENHANHKIPGIQFEN